MQPAQDSTAEDRVSRIRRSSIQFGKSRSERACPRVPRFIQRLQARPNWRDVAYDQSTRDVRPARASTRMLRVLALTRRLLDDTLYEVRPKRDFLPSWNQYRVVMEENPAFKEPPTRNSTAAPRGAFSQWSDALIDRSTIKRSVSRRQRLLQFEPLALLLGQAVQAVETKAWPAGKYQTGFQGTAQAFRVSLAN